jgi:hypothetical protein
MSSHVRKDVTNPHNNLFHHGLIKLLVLAELEKQEKTWDEFIYQFANPHITIKTIKKTLDLGTVTPPKPLMLKLFLYQTKIPRNLLIPLQPHRE